VPRNLGFTPTFQKAVRRAWVGGVLVKNTTTELSCILRAATAINQLKQARGSVGCVLLVERNSIAMTNGD
jgi:hypothetical protein